LFLGLLLAVAALTVPRGAMSARGRIALVTVFAGFVLASIYHFFYDTPILAVPVALTLAAGKTVSTRPLMLFAWLYVGLNFASRGTFMYRIGGAFESAVLHQWPPLVSLIALAIGTAVLVSEHRATERSRVRAPMNITPLR
jgi:hypothetical protein